MRVQLTSLLLISSGLASSWESSSPPSSSHTHTHTHTQIHCGYAHPKGTQSDMSGLIRSFLFNLIFNINKPPKTTNLWGENKNQKHQWTTTRDNKRVRWKQDLETSVNKWRKQSWQVKKRTGYSSTPAETTNMLEEEKNNLKKKKTWSWKKNFKKQQL